MLHTERGLAIPMRPIITSSTILPRQKTGGRITAGIQVCGQIIFWKQFVRSSMRIRELSCKRNFSKYFMRIRRIAFYGSRNGLSYGLTVLITLLSMLIVLALINPGGKSVEQA